MTTLETILIIYILLNWFLMIMFAILPKGVTDKVFYLFVIVCPPLGIGVIRDLIKRKHDKRKEQKEELENEKN